MTEMRDGTEVPRTLEERQVKALESIAESLAALKDAAIDRDGHLAVVSHEG